MAQPASVASLIPMPPLRRSRSITYSAMTPFWLASPPLVAVRLMPSDTSNTWKMITVAMRVMAMVTSSSTMLMPRCRLAG